MLEQGSSVDSAGAQLEASDYCEWWPLGTPRPWEGFETGPFEVGKPAGYRGPFNHQGFSAAVDRYMRHCIGKKAKLMGMGDTAANIEIVGSRFVSAPSDYFEYANDSAEGW